MVERRPLYYYLRQPEVLGGNFRSNAERRASADPTRKAITAFAKNGWRSQSMYASLSMRGVAAAGLVTLAILLGAAPKASAEDVTLEVWSHEADEPAKVAFRELA